ncbi:MAG: mRNA interferase RelE/StbE [Pyrinomonadaceae bacterium]|jgi:mRNA interferase RelE/StbE|nr:mRNA interferase RelE/StbE [Pyrinomonadaceae bacterium]
MAWQIEFKSEAIEDLTRIDKLVAQRIVGKAKWLCENFEQITPQPLTGPMKGLFKLRVGDYRIIYSTNPERELLTIHLIGHRREIYR